MTMSRMINRVKRTGTGRPAQPPPYFGTRQQDEAECAASALRVTASVISTRKFQKISGVFPEIYINSVTSERQSIQRLSLRSNGIHFRIQRITLLLDIGLKPQETA